jgi:hypothetical protein
MKRRLFFIPFGLVLILLLLLSSIPGIPVRGEPNAFIISYADATNTLSLSGSSSLFSLIGNVGDRIVLQYAKASKVHGLTPLPQTFLSLLQNVRDRFVLQYAKASNTFTLGYPIDLIGDTTAPPIISVDEHLSSGGMLVSISSSEYTLAELEYGTSPGNYPNNLVDDKFSVTHTFSLTGYDSGETIYFRVTLTDRSSNTTISPEYSFVPLRGVHLPLIIR